MLTAHALLDSHSPMMMHLTAHVTGDPFDHSSYFGAIQIAAKNIKKNMNIFALLNGVKNNNGWIIQSPSLKYQDAHATVLSRLLITAQNHH